MADDRTTYPEYRHVMVARYGKFRLDRVRTRTNLTDEAEWLPELVFELDASTEFDFMSILFLGGGSAAIKVGQGHGSPSPGRGKW